MRQHLRRLIVDDEAATAVEYAVVLALVLLAVFGSVALVGLRTGEKWDSINTNLDGFGFGS